MQAPRSVSADPTPVNQGSKGPCFACSTWNSKNPSLPVLLAPVQMRVRAAVDTGELPNPFLTLDKSVTQEVSLCTGCRHKSKGWDVICNPRKYGKDMARKALNAWKSRCRPNLPKPQKVLCNICEILKQMNKSSVQIKASNASQERNPTRDWSLFNICVSTKEVKDTFLREMHRYTGIGITDLECLLQDPSSIFFCYLHLNHSRYARNTARDVQLQEVGDRKVCVFQKYGCSTPKGSENDRSAYLWRLPVLDTESIEDMEEYSELEDSVKHHSGGVLNAAEVMGATCCRVCLYIVTEGKKSSKPAFDIETLPNPIDQCTVRCILFALEDEKKAQKSTIFEARAYRNVRSVAHHLRQSSIVYATSEKSVVRMIAFPEVARCRKALVSSEDSFSKTQGSNIDDKTLQKRLDPVLAAKGIVLKKLGYKLRCYISVLQIDSVLSSMATSKGSPSGRFTRPTVLETRAYLDEVARHFTKQKEKYWAGKWSLSYEVLCIPTPLWSDIVLLMASERRLASWNFAAKGNGTILENVFPVSNTIHNLPSPSIEQALNDSNNSEYTRADLLVCVRTLKEIEQIVYCRTKGVAGPLTTSISIAGICEMSPSFVSVLNGLGLFLSYNSTERYRQSLIAEREREGPWDFNTMDTTSMPVLQFDNWDITPLHSVKVDGKPLPKVNGSLLQNHVRKRRFSGEGETLKSQPPEKRIRTSGWKDISVLGSREDFAKQFNSDVHAAVLNQFNDVVFGIASMYRRELIGGKDMDTVNYNTSIRTEFEHGQNGAPVNFRTLLLSCFKPHGGRDCTDDSSHKQHVVYVEISRDSAADILTVRRFINMIEHQLRPGSEGRPRYVILGGDELSHRMFCKLWRESWRKHPKRDSIPPGGRLHLHEWLVPFPGFFHAEKQAMYSICKEMLDGLGLHEMASFCGLTSTQVSNFLSHSHARNNRAVLFNMTCAMVIHTTDMLLMEDNSIAEAVSHLHRNAGKKKVSRDGSHSSGKSAYPIPSENNATLPDGRLYQATTKLVSADIINTGRLIRKRVEEVMTAGPNGKHFVGTVLFSCLLPTLGFHVLSRTGHTDMIQCFWFKHNSILHSTTHLKYQELSLFYAFFRSIIPDVVAAELYNNKPGRSVMKLLSFTGLGSEAVDTRGWTYVHSDEALEMLIVRHLKSLSSNFIGHLENSAAWLMQVSMFRSLIRYMTGASRTLGRKRQEADGGEADGPLSFYDRNASQWRTVARMVHEMRECGFLNLEHRGSEWLSNLFCSPPRRMNISKDQEALLNVTNAGETTAKLHASVVFPDVFGALSEADRETHFGGKKFKRWTRSRAVPRASQSMSRSGGSAAVHAADTGSTPVFASQDKSFPKRPITKEAFLKVVTDRKRVISKMKDAFYIEERKAFESGQKPYLLEVMKRWDEVHNSRYLISPFADCFLSQNGTMNHGSKSRFLKYSIKSSKEVVYTFNNTFTSSGPSAITSRRPTSQPHFNAYIRPFFSIQLDVMNALHYRGHTGERGTILQSIVIGKMKSILRGWLKGDRARKLQQVHLHIDDPNLVISQKTAEQERRDSQRRKSMVGQDGTDIAPRECSVGFQDELSIPWSQLICNRYVKDEMASFHLFCAAVAAHELLVGHKESCSIFLHGGSFAISTMFAVSTPKDFTPVRYTEGLNEVFKGSVILRRDGEKCAEYCSNLFVIPRSRCLVFHTSGHAHIGSEDIYHGESETRFVAVFKAYVLPPFESFKSVRRGSGSTARAVLEGITDVQCRAELDVSASVIVSDDTDVFMILLCNEVMHKQGVMQVLTDSIHDVDEAITYLNDLGLDGGTAGMVYAIAGCDFTPAVFSLSHETFFKAMCMFACHTGSLKPPVEGKEDVHDTFLCASYLLREGKTRFYTPRQSKREMESMLKFVREGSKTSKDVLALRKSIFESTNEVGSELWRLDVRNFIADEVSFSNLLPTSPLHYKLQLRRAQFVVQTYWGSSSQHDLSRSRMGGCTLEHGYNADGTVILEKPEDVRLLQLRIRDSVKVCRCKGDCTSRRCSCKRNQYKCIGCECSDVLCQNKVSGALNVNEMNNSNDSVAPTQTVVQYQSGLVQPESEHGAIDIDDDNSTQSSSACSNADERMSQTDILDLDLEDVEALL